MIKRPEKRLFPLEGDLPKRRENYNPKRHKEERNIQTAENDKTTSDQSLYAKIGSSEAFNDISTEPSYEWDTKISPYIKSSYDELRRMKPLKHLCAMKIAENQNMLNLQLLRASNWLTWQLVWNYITLWRRDSFLLFQLFAGAFHQERTFQCHPNTTDYPSSKKKVIFTNTLPNSRNHRVERLFSNVKISQFINSLNLCSFKNLVFLELAKPVGYDDLLNLTNLTNLTSLKIARTNTIPDSVIYSWCTALRNKKWTNLQLLSLPEISQDSMIRLQKQSSNSKLMYLEIQTMAVFNMKRDWEKIDYEDWDLLNDKSLNNLPWAMKSLAILRKFKIEGHSELPDDSTVILDFNILNHSYRERVRYLEGEYDHLWNMGEYQSYYQGLLLKKKPELDVREHEQVRQSVLKKKPILKTKGRVKSLNSFFDLR